MKGRPTRSISPPLIPPSGLSLAPRKTANSNTVIAIAFASDCGFAWLANGSPPKNLQKCACLPGGDSTIVELGLNCFEGRGSLSFLEGPLRDHPAPSNNPSHTYNNAHPRPCVWSWPACRSCGNSRDTRMHPHCHTLDSH